VSFGGRLILRSVTQGVNEALGLTEDAGKGVPRASRKARGRRFGKRRREWGREGTLVVSLAGGFSRPVSAGRDVCAGIAAKFVARAGPYCKLLHIDSGCHWRETPPVKVGRVRRIRREP
jgi:hypothetical protein